MPSAEDLNRTGAEWHLRGDLEGAKLHYIAALEEDPCFLPAMKNLAVVYGIQDHYRPAITLARRVLTLEPHDWRVWNNLGTWLMLIGDFDVAEPTMQEAVRLAPTATETWHNLALLSHRQGNCALALKYLDKVFALGNNLPSVYNDQAHMLLKLGQSLHDALEAYEVRWEMIDHGPVWDAHIAEWQGQSLDGKRLLLHAEQGFGDTIMCLRFAQDLKALGAEVVVAVPWTLQRLVEHQGFATIDSNTQVADPERYDYQSPMYGALRWLGVEWDTINASPYIEAPIASHPIAVDGRMFNIGVCWASGQRNNEMDVFRRVAPIEPWLALAERPDVCLWSLQKDNNREDLEVAQVGGLIRDVTPALHDWADTAAFVAQLDLIIAVDTAVAHLAGAMGKPTYLLAQHASCWRWWNIEAGDGWPWYNQMRIFRQPSPGDWLTPIADAIGALRQGPAVSVAA